MTNANNSTTNSTSALITLLADGREHSEDFLICRMGLYGFDPQVFELTVDALLDAGVILSTVTDRYETCGRPFVPCLVLAS